MSPDSLAKFAPRSVNRDALLLAIGAAKAKSRRRWPLLCAGLSCTQLLTLVIAWWCWPRPVVESFTRHDTPTLILLPDSGLAAPPDRWSILALRLNPDDESELHGPDSGEPVLLPPLRAGDCHSP